MKVYLCEPIAESAFRRLAEHFTVTDSMAHPEEIYGIISRNIPVTEKMIAGMPNLKVISVHGVGLDAVDLAAAKKYGIAVTNTPGQNAQSVAELTISFILALTRKLKLNDKSLSHGKLPAFGSPELIGHELSGKKAGLIGSGDIAKKTAFILKYGFSCEVYSYNPHRSQEELMQMGFQKIETLKELVQKMDIVAIHCPLTPETRGMINEEVLNEANPELILVNTARGGIVEEKALYHALTAGKIKAAASDVFTKEPPEKENPLLGLDQFIATFHVGNATTEALERTGNAAVDNLMKILL